MNVRKLRKRTKPITFSGVPQPSLFPPRFNDPEGKQEVVYYKKLPDGTVVINPDWEKALYEEVYLWKE